MVNRVVLVGRLVADPELKYTTQGVAVASMRIAVDRFTKNDQGEYEADFFSITAWRRTAEFASTYLNKGRLIAVDGRLQTRSWTAQDGSKRSTVEVVADSIQGLDRKQDGTGMGAPQASEDFIDSNPAPASAPARPAQRPAKAAPPPPVDDLDDSDPFADE